MIKRTILILLVICMPVLPAAALDQHYSHDDGSSETALGFFGGDQVWLQYFDPLGGMETITHVSTTFGSPEEGGQIPLINTAITVYIWDDPDNDGDPDDAVLLGSGSGRVRTVDGDFFTHYFLDNPVTVTSRFFVGVKINCPSSLLPKSLDQSQPSNGRAWAAGDAGGGFNAYNLTDNSHPPVDQDSTANPGVWLLRAHRLTREVFCDSFDHTFGTTSPRWWTEESGDWSLADRRLVSEALAANQVITVDSIDQADGCVEVQGFYGDGFGLRSFGTVARYASASDRVLVKLQENGTNGFFNACYAYDGGSTVLAVQGQNFGTEPVLQVQYDGPQVTVRIDVDGDGGWDHEYPVTVTTIHGGLTGASAYNQVGFDDWHCGPSPDAWGGEMIDFQGVPEDYWSSAGGQNLGGYFPGLTFGTTAVIVEATVYGYNDIGYPWHSFDSVLGSLSAEVVQIDFDEPKTHVGFWFTTASGDGIAEAFDEYGTLLARAVMHENMSRNDYISLDGSGIRSVTLWDGQSTTMTIDDLEYQPANSPPNTVDASFDCSPTSGVLPFQVSMNIELANAHETENRRLAARINVRLANNTAYTNWRSGYTNLRPLSSYTASWSQNLPALSALVGDNNFTLVVVDVTPAPYNQPPYAPSGDAEARACTITGYAP